MSLSDFDDDVMTDVTIIGLAQRPSVMDTIIRFAGHDETGTLVQVAVDHRPASDIVAVLCDEGEVFVRCEGWQVDYLPADFDVFYPTTL